MLENKKFGKYETPWTVGITVTFYDKQGRKITKKFANYYLS